MTPPTEPQIAKRWPPFFTAGATFKVDRTFTRYDNTDWAYSLLLAGERSIQFAGTPQITPDPTDAALFHIVLAPADTQPLNPNGAKGRPYQYVERLTCAATGEVFDVDYGRVMVAANLAVTADGEAVSFAERMLKRIEAAIAARLSGNDVIENYSIEGRSVSKLSMPQLQELRGTYAAIVYRQRNPGRVSTTVEVSFPTMAYGPYPRGWPRLLS
jgi:hypothetical protein